MGIDTIKVKNILNTTRIPHMMLGISPFEKPNVNFQIKNLITKIKISIMDSPAE